MFIYIMKDIEEGQLLKCLKRIQEKKGRGGSFVYLVIRDKDRNKDEYISFRSPSDEQYQIWTLWVNGNETDIQYNVKDYIN